MTLRNYCVFLPPKTWSLSAKKLTVTSAELSDMQPIVTVDGIPTRVMASWICSYPLSLAEQVPWFRGSAWSYMRGGLSTRDHDYGIFNNIHHDIGTHVVHHLFPQVPASV